MSTSTQILVVEDSATQAEALRMLLEDEGFTVAVANSGEAALSLVAARAYDIIVSDVTMPGMDGYELCRRIKRTPDRHDVPVMLLTALSDPMDIIHGLEAGADNYVTKPYDPTHLVARIRSVLENRALRKGVRNRVGVNIVFLGSSFTINSDKEQILDLLMSTFEDAVLQNRQLRERESELRIAKAALARYAGTLEQRLRDVLDSVPDVLFSVSPDRSEVYLLSAAASRVLGFTAAECEGRMTRWERAIHPEDRETVAAAYAAARVEPARRTFEYRVERRGGSPGWIEETIVPIVDERGKLERLDGIARDITDRKRLEQQLRLAQKMEAIGTLAGGVAHDFNNLLAAIRGSVELLLLDVEAASPQRADLDDVLKVVDRAASLTRQLLAFGRKQVLEPQALDLNRLIDDLSKLLRRVIGADVSLRVTPTGEMTTVVADPGQLEQVIMNLCINARDAMPKGGEIAMQTERVALDERFASMHPWSRTGEFVRVTIADTGEGMDSATQQRIFEPFFTTKEAGRGTGLGLAVVYGIVKQHAGLIHVYSEVGKGTTFRIYLPFSPATPSPVVPPPPLELHTGAETILLAEDDDALRTTVSRMLDKLGYRVIAVADGREAVAMLSRSGPKVDLAILDVVMPGITGPEVFEQVRPFQPALRFLFTTGYSPGTAHMLPLQSLPGQVLHKPYGVAALATAVRQALTRSDGAPHSTGE